MLGLVLEGAGRRRSFPVSGLGGLGAFDVFFRLGGRLRRDDFFTCLDDGLRRSTGGSLGCAGGHDDRSAVSRATTSMAAVAMTFLAIAGPNVIAAGRSRIRAATRAHVAIIGGKTGRKGISRRGIPRKTPIPVGTARFHCVSCSDATNQDHECYDTPAKKAVSHWYSLLIVERHNAARARRPSIDISSARWAVEKWSPWQEAAKTSQRLAVRPHIPCCR